jgi:redox-sensitive bicupin YhaK (pirin superfamily)
MSAGTGVRHSEFNLEDETTRLFQIWIIPDERGATPTWGAKPFPKGGRSGRFVALASGVDGDADVLPIRADARLLGATLKAGESADYPIDANRHAYLVPAKGSVTINGLRLAERDGAAITGETSIRVTAVEDSELVLVDAA